MVLIMETIAKVLRDQRVHKKGIRQISRERNFSRNTVRKVLRGEFESHSYVRSERPRSKLGEYCERLEAMLENNAARSRRERWTVAQIHDALQQAGFDGNYGAVCHYARRWRQYRNVCW